MNQFFRNFRKLEGLGRKKMEPGKISQVRRPMTDARHVKVVATKQVKRPKDDAVKAPTVVKRVKAPSAPVAAMTPAPVATMSPVAVPTPTIPLAPAVVAPFDDIDQDELARMIYDLIVEAEEKELHLESEVVDLVDTGVCVAMDVERDAVPSAPSSTGEISLFDLADCEEAMPSEPVVPNDPPSAPREPDVLPVVTERVTAPAANAQEDEEELSPTFVRPVVVFRQSFSYDLAPKKPSRCDSSATESGDGQRRNFFTSLDTLMLFCPVKRRRYVVNFQHTEEQKVGVAPKVLVWAFSRKCSNKAR